MRSPKFLTLLTVVALVAVMAVQVEAQQRGRGRGGPGGPGGGFGPGGGGKLGLLRRDEVKKELELLDEQTADIEKLGESLRPQRGGTDTENLSEEERQAAREKARAEFNALSDDEKAKRMEEFRAEQAARQKEAEAKLAEILLPHQLDRLNQIELQQAGLGALETDEVAKGLGLSDAVQADIAATLKTNREKMMALFQGGNRGGQGGNRGGSDADREAARAKFDELRKANETEILGKLTQSQRDKFEALKGEPFEMARYGFGRGGNRDGQGGGRPQRPPAQ